MSKINFYKKYLFLVIVLAMFFDISIAFATDKYWLGSTSVYTSNTANWSLTSGGTGGASLPNFDDIIIFDANSLDAYFDINMNVLQIDIQSGFTHTITQDPDIIIDIANPSPLILLSTSGQQIATTTTPVTNQSLGGAFTLNSTATTTLTSFKLKQRGSLSPDLISNLTLFYKAEETCSTSTPADADTFGTFTDFDENNFATTTGLLEIMSNTNTCLYLNYDLAGEYSTSTLGHSLDFEIVNPATDLVLSNGNITNTYYVNIPGRTILSTDAIISMLSIKMPNPAEDPTVYYFQDYAVWKTVAGGRPYRLTNPNIKVHNLTFTEIGSSFGNPLIKITITLSNVTVDAPPSYINYTKTLTTSAMGRTRTKRE